MDGTFLDSTSRTTKKNLDAVSTLARQGHLFVPASGRTLSEMPQEVVNHPDVRYIIHSGGARIYDKKTKRSFGNYLDNGKMKKIKELLCDSQVVIAVRREGKAFVDGAKHKKGVYSTYRISPLVEDFLFRYSIPVENFDAFFDALDDVEAICIYFRYVEEQTVFEKKAKETGIFNVTASEPYNVELTSPDASKGQALTRLCEIIKRPLADTVFMGDSRNDISALRIAGLALVCANASDEVKTFAHQVIVSCDENTLDYVVKNVLKV